jgi:hypothetical protein
MVKMVYPNANILYGNILLHTIYRSLEKTYFHRKLEIIIYLMIYRADMLELMTIRQQFGVTKTPLNGQHAVQAMIACCQGNGIGPREVKQQSKMPHQNVLGDKNYD